MAKDKYISRRRNKLEKLMYEIAIDLGIKRGLTNDEIRENFEQLQSDVIDLMDFQDPETSLLSLLTIYNVNDD